MTSWFMSHRHLHSKDHHILLAFWRALDEKLTNRDNLQTWNSNSTTVRRPSLWIWSWGILWMKCKCPLQLPKRRINLTRQNVMEGVTKLQNRMERELGTMLTFRLALSMTQAGIARVESGSHLKKLGNAWTKSMQVPCGRWWCNLQKLSSTMLTSFLSQEILIATKDVNIWTHQKIDVLDEFETAPIANHQVGNTLIFPGRVDEIWQTLNLWNEVVDCRSWAYCCKPLYCHQRCIEHFRHNNIMSSIFQLNGSQQYIKWTLNWAQQQMFWMKSDTGALAPVTYYWS